MIQKKCETITNITTKLKYLNFELKKIINMTTHMKMCLFVEVCEINLY